MDIEEIIYIVVTIVIFIVTIMGNSRKKPKPVVENYEEEEYSLNDFEKLLERRTEYIEEEVEETGNEQHDEKLMEMGQAVKSLYSQEEEEKKSKPEVKTHEQEEAEDYIPEDGFDVRSAVIYSSILERKQFRN